MKSTIRLFKAVPITERKKKTDKELLKETIKKGFIFAPEVVYNYSKTELNDLVKIVEKELGLSAEQMNSSFHKSWKKIKEASIEQLVIEQIIHYITTYGYESLGIYRESTVYIPYEELKLPKIDVDKISLIVIKGYTKEELREKLLGLLKLGVALSEDTMKDVIDLATYIELTEKEITDTRNKEVKCALYDYFGLFPEDPVEFLRFMIYKSINKTLLIKDRQTIQDIKATNNLSVLGVLVKYKDKYGLKRLAEIFYRFKPLFLAFRTSQKLKSTINRIRKLAVKYHKPMKPDYLNSVTANIKKGTGLSKTKLLSELDKVNVFRKARLAYALKFRTGDIDSILYRIRNGKSFATSFEFENVDKAEEILDVVIDSIVKDFKNNVKGKKIYIPDNIKYTLPATEKQFTGYFPSGTYVTVPRDIIVGVHWENVNHHRIDLDLSLIDIIGGKLGWDGYYRSEDSKILFSGDVTDAPRPKGASELFYVNKQTRGTYAMLVNYYNYENVEVPFKILAAQEKVNGGLKYNYTVNPNNVVAIATSKIIERQKLLGLLITSPEENKFYFAEAYMGNSITSYGSDYVNNARKYLISYYENTIGLSEILERAGAKFVKDEKKADINLSPDKLEKDTILNLMKKGEK